MSYTDVLFLTMWKSVFALAVTAAVIWETSSTGQPQTQLNNCSKVKQLQEELVEACNCIIIKGLFEQDEASPGVSKIISSISYFISMAQLALYSKGQTNTELMEALNVKNKDDIRIAFPGIIRSIRELQGGGMNIAYKTYVNDQYKFSAPFKNDSVTVFDAAPEEVNFNYPCQAANIINKWVSDNTKGNIDLVNENMLNSMTQLVLANAVSFKGIWQQEFNANLTQLSNFYVNPQKTVTVKMMQQTGKFNYAYSPDLDAELVEIPFQNNSMSFVFALPTQQDGLRNVLDKLRSPPMTYKVLSELRQETVNLSLPKFDNLWKFDVKDVLKPAGVESIFGPNSELSGIVVPDEPLSVSNAVQTAFISIIEEGAKSDSTTAAVVATRALPRSPQPEIVVRADHPFLYGIRLNKYLLFILSGTFYG